jgi:hypothetical protein
MEHWRCLLARRQALQHRLQQARALTSAGPPSLQLRKGVIEKVEKTSVDAQQLSNAYRQAQLSERDGAALRGRARGWSSNSDYRGDLPRPISSFRHRVPVTTAQILAHLPELQPTSSLSADISYAIRVLEQQVRGSLCEPEGDICWFYQLQLSDVTIAYSSGTFSPECSLSATLAFTATCIEAMLLVLEHECISAVRDPTYSPPLHPHLSATHTAPPQLPNPALLARLEVRTSPSACRPMAYVVESAMEPMLRAYRARLPCATWRRACVCCLCALETSVDLIGRGGTANAGRPVPAGETLAWGELDVAMATMLQHITCVLFRVLQEPSAEVRSVHSVSAEKRGAPARC